ncbi:hypothetical protein PENTCL1PPCAC_4292, partial [Pristionchus entomophagus]
ARCSRHRLLEMMRSFKQIALTEVEIAAAVALILTNHDCSSLDERIGIVCRPMKDAVIEQLSKHYDQTCDPSRSTMRLGDLLSFLTEFQDFAEAQKRDHSLLSMFTEEDRPGFLFSLTDTR